MQRYIIRRLLHSLIVVWVLTLITFSISYVVPGDPVLTMAGPLASPKLRQLIREKYLLDEPLFVQYMAYMKRLLHGDLGFSFITRTRVSDQIAANIVPTFKLALAALIVELSLGLPAGIISAIRRYSLFDRVTTLVILVGLSAPPFWLGIVLLYYFAYKVSIFPLGGYGGLQYLFLPAFTIGIRGCAWYARMLRSSMLEVLGADYVRTARAKGLKERFVILRHVLRNAITPIVTMIGVDLGYFMSGIVVVEVVFGWPGIGYRAWRSITHGDTPAIMGITLFIAACVVLANLAVDIAYAWIDPRVRRE